MPKKKSSTKTNYKALKHDIDTDQLLLHSRQIFLFGDITLEGTQSICQALISLDLISHDPILLRINSLGGGVEAGFGIIDTIAGLKSPVYTSIYGGASSVAALIFLIGQKRFMSEHSVFMLHDMMTPGCIGNEYRSKVVARIDQQMHPLWEMIKQYIKSKTLLTDSDLETAMNQELYIWANTAIEKGVAHKIIKTTKG